MSYLNLVLPGAGQLGSTGLGTSGSPSKNVSKITVFGITILVIYTITKILNFYGIGVEKYGSYLVFYIFLLICVNVLNADNPKL